MLVSIIDGNSHCMIYLYQNLTKGKSKENVMDNNFNNQNQGYPNQGYPKQGYPNQGYPMNNLYMKTEVFLQ